MRRATHFLIVLSALALVLAPAAAHADGFISPFAGGNFANDTGNGRATFGVDAGWMGAGVAGFEFDLGYSPNFFGSPGGFGDNHVLTTTGNLIVGVPIGGTRGSGIRPYASIGGGIIQTRVTGTAGPTGVAHINDYDPAISAGGGVMGFLSDHVGVRGDVRYFRNFRDDPVAGGAQVQFGSFHFWRASIGVVLRP